MKPKLRAATVLAVLVLATACASGGTRNSSNGPITSEDLTAGRFADVPDALRKLRPGLGAYRRHEGVT